MITRIARNDVVRVKRTGEVGTVKGWADHEDLDRNGTILDVEVSRGRSVQANGLALEFVANAKREYKGGRLAAWWVLWAVTGLWAGWLAWTLNTENHTSIAMTVFVGSVTWSFWFTLLRLWLIDPRKTRVRLPKRQTRQAVHPSQR